MLKVCLITSSFDPIKGIGMNEVNLSRGLKELGLDVEVICTTQNNINLKVGITPFPITPALPRQIVRLAPDIVHATEYFQLASQLALASCRLKSIPFTFTHHMYASIASKFRYPFMFYERLTAMPLFYVKKMIAVSTAAKIHLLNIGVPPKRIEVIPTGIDTELFSPQNVQHTTLRKKLAIHPDEKLLLTIAKLHKTKGLCYLIKACAKLKESEPRLRFKLFILGKGPEKANLLGLIEKYGLVRNCILLEHHFPHQELPAIYKACDLFVLPSTYEQLGNVLIEATSMEKPIVCSKVGGMTDIVKDGVNGLLVPPANPKALAKAILKLLEDPDLASEMGKEGRRIAESRFHYLVTAKRTLEVYKELLRLVGR